MEPIVSRDTVRRLALDATVQLAVRGIPITNPYPQGTAAHELFEADVASTLVELEEVAV